MRSPNDPRHLARRKIIQLLFEWQFRGQEIADKRIVDLVSNLTKIDSVIAKNAPEFPVEKIANMDLAVLRLAVFELIIEKKEPHKAIIDEAIELSREFGGETSPEFINGVLGKLIKQNGR